ncbi:c-type cytochrome [Bacteroides sp. 519]|uniref:c-type cytochrome n=1 Tax=Bacteroides sp. 519 TaxID=2302937 RepID=UPI0019402C60|nr:c-type cytochrome [Bacteroides sp. 519]NDV57311.1 cell surface protein [Bacteroides sp. 519]
MKKITYILFVAILCLLISCDKQNIFAPDKMFVDSNNEKLYVANRSENELIRLKTDLHTIEGKVKFKSPVTDMDTDANGHLWIVCDGYNGELCELETSGLKIISQTKIGNSPSSVVYNSLSNSLWITQRFKNRINEINPQTKEIISTFEVGREPVDMISFASDSLLLVVNNMPEMSSLSFPLAAQLSVVDILSKRVSKRIMLPNGSTDVKAVAASHDGSYAYITHLLARYQLPTNQVDRGWMSTNALSIVDLQKRELITTVLLDTPQKGSANPWGVTVSIDNKFIIVAASGVDELVAIDRIALHNRLRSAQNGQFETPSTQKWDDIPNDAGFLHGISNYIPTEGKGARTVVSMNKKIYVANYFTGEIVEIQINSGEKTVNRPYGVALSSTTQGKGNMYFHDATLGFQGWQSCATCHPNDARADGLNWDNLNDGMGNPKNTKTLLLSHKTAPSMITGIRKNAEVAVRAGFKHILFAEPNEEVCSAMDEYLKSLSPEPSPYLKNGKLTETAQKGKITFNNHCAFCHSGAYYTDLKQYDVPWTNGASKGVKMDVPALNESWRTAPYLYDGRAYTMREMLEIHGPNVSMSDEELDELAEYILSL